MNSKIAAVAQAVSNDPALAERLAAASSAEDRVAILAEAGLEIPTEADLGQVDDEMLAQLSAAGVGPTAGIDPIAILVADSGLTRVIGHG